MPQTLTLVVDLSDGGSTTTPEKEEHAMFDLAPGIGQMLLTETATNAQQANHIARNGFVTANNVLQYAAARRSEEVDLIEGRTASGLISTPVGPPARQA